MTAMKRTQLGFCFLCVIILRRSQYRVYITSNARIIVESFIAKDLKGNGSGLVDVLSRHFAGRAEE